MSKHTPGPWFYGIAYEGKEQPLSYRGPGYYDNAGIMAGDETIVGCDEYDIFGPLNQQEREANVRLICAAPDLLAALEEILSRFDDDNLKLTVDAIQASRAAIKKAKG